MSVCVSVCVLTRCVVNSIAMHVRGDTNNSESAMPLARLLLGETCELAPFDPLPLCPPPSLTTCGIYLRTINYYKCRGRHPDSDTDPDTDTDTANGNGHGSSTPWRQKGEQNVCCLQKPSKIVYGNL